MLEARQVGWLIGGVLLALTLVFALGVMVGRQLALDPEAPQTAAMGPTDEAALPEIRLTFHDELTKRAPPPPKPPPPPKKEPVVVKAEAPPTRPDPAPEPRLERAVEQPAERPSLPPAPDPAPATGEPVAIAEPSPLEEPPVPEARWTVQFAASPVPADADRVAESLRDKGLSPYLVEADIPGKGVFHRVRVGRFVEREEAERFLRQAREAHGLSGTVMPLR